MRGNGLEIGGPILLGQGVESPSYSRHVSEYLALLNPRGSLELHVLYPVGQPGLSWELVSTPDAVPGPDRNDRRRVVLLQNDSQPVVQLSFDDVIGGWWRH